jgi:hypothetical protein
MNPDYVTWYGFARLQQDVLELREIDKAMRAVSEQVQP